LSLDQEQTIIDARCHLHASTYVRNSSTINDHDDDVNVSNSNDDINCTIVEENQRLPNGTRVMIEQKSGEIIDNEMSYHYSVDFGDDTFSHDMYVSTIDEIDTSVAVHLLRLPEDILDSNPANLLIGSNIRIKWTDGTIYTCKYLGRNRVLLYHIKIGHEIRQMQRNEFSLDIAPSPPPTPCQIESKSNPAQSWIPCTMKRSNQQTSIKRKRRRRLLLSSSSSSSSSDESSMKND
jgi:hypothetical protein